MVDKGYQLKTGRNILVSVKYYVTIRNTRRRQREVRVASEAARWQQEYYISTTLKERSSSLAVNSTKTAFDALKLNQGTYKEQLQKASKKVSKKVKKHSHYAAQAVILSVIGVFVVASNVGPTQNASSFGGGFGGLIEDTTVDEVATAQVAKQIAQGANLLIANNVANLADSLEARTEFAASTDSYLAKPQIVSTDARTRQDIIKYTAKKNDTVSSLARQFGITSDSIRWANDISGDSLSVGDKLEIPPVSGLLYEVGANDTATSLAEKYNANADQIVSFNDAELTGLVEGMRIVIPDGEEPAPVQRTYFAPVYGGNGYSYGYCTWHVANRRAAIGRPIPRNLGHAVTWASIAAAGGLTVEENPIAGAVLWHKNYIAGGYGHVGFVESIDSKGNAVVSDMNYSAGWNAESRRTITKAEFNDYLFIY